MLRTRPQGATAGDDMGKREYRTPEVQDYGTVSEVTEVGQTKPGADVLPGGAHGRDGGSISPPGLG